MAGFSNMNFRGHIWIVEYFSCCHSKWIPACTESCLNRSEARYTIKRLKKDAVNIPFRIRKYIRENR